MNTKNLLPAILLLVVGLIVGHCWTTYGQHKIQDTGSAAFQDSSTDPIIADKKILLESLQTERDSLVQLLGYEVIIKEGKRYNVDKSGVLDCIIFVDYKIQKVNRGSMQSATVPVPESELPAMYTDKDLTRDTTVFVIPPFSFAEYEQFKINKLLEFYYSKPADQ
jgi:hypothetical protein